MASEMQQQLQQFLQTTAGKGPFATIYMALEPNQSADKSKIMFKNAAKHIEEVMKETWPDVDWEPYAKQMSPWVEDTQAWDGVAQGFGLLTNGQQTYVRHLNHFVNETAMVTATPQILPLILDNQRAFNFDLLALSSDQIALYHNAGTELTPVELPDDAPKTMKGTLGTELRGGSLNSVSQGAEASYHGHNEKSAEEEIDLRRYFQEVDKYISDNYSKPFKRMLIVVGLPQNQAIFHELSKNVYLSNTYQIEENPGALGENELKARVEDLRQKMRQDKMAHAVERIDRAKSQKRYRIELGQIVTALVNGAVQTLYIRSGARVYAQLDENQKIDTSSEQGKHNNLLNDLAELTLEYGGEVQLLNVDYFEEPVGAVLRY
ncbi:baeRF6 domain-containing protein [Lacticaseibacillus saniviri]|uniref:Bacterial archaeo-eukaryotic release factor family 6 domain-containing protein n=1 Tax=Lacticaseibacillus saniviri JCM 17471 = DSM 24301 TaxID=1293598 RepID=A0A0R2MSB8_9LACO|nr:hypothetical protein [Lacticaseibacillus saniviri]KRO16425.1 hypothetical protein IV56_GL001207 [Lacticaseibacillus saniviri JCM 17471 = DSM 24301]MCG4282884.1 hypothetical protein [Lacticaseibacillus saniviri]